MKNNCRDWLALAYYTEHQQAGAWESVDGLFMTAYFKETTKLYQALQDSAVENNQDPELWLVEEAKSQEAVLMDRHLRILRQTRQAREKLKDTGNSGARVQLDADRLRQQINETLLALGKIYLAAATKEISDITKLKNYTELTFKAMAMVYQRKPSADALSAIRQINEIQRAYLYRMAQFSWQNARAAVEAGRSEEVDEHYFKATQRYLQCMSRWGEGDRDQHAEEFQKLKQEIAAWRIQKQKSNANEKI